MQIEPSLATVFARATVPGDPECLEAATRQLNQVLLQRIDAKRVFDFVVVHYSVGPVGPHHESIAVAKKE
jgi:hypothetical protein